MMLLAYSLALVLCTVTSAHLCMVTRGGVRRLEFSPTLLLAISYSLYSMGLPISRLVFRSAPDPVVDDAYLLPHLLGAVGLLLGLIPLAPRVYPAHVETSLASAANRIRPPLVVGAIVAGIVWQVFVLLMQVRGGAAGLLSSYATGEGYTPPGFLGTLVVITSNIAIATVVLAFPALRQRGWLRNFVIISPIVLGGLFAVRGHRNLLGMLALPILALHMFGRRIRVRALLIGLASGYIFLYGVGIIRNFGLAKISSAVGKVEYTKAFDPLGGEFGTSFSVFSRFQRLPVRRTPEFGATYTRDVILNIVPHQFWPDRPPTAAIAFSMDYYRTKHLKLGLGYSPIIEAIRNFGLWGIVPMFALFAILVRKLEDWAQSGQMTALLSYGFLLPAVMNWNRIDMATNVKMFLVSTMIAAMLRHVLYDAEPAPSGAARRVHAPAPLST